MFSVHKYLHKSIQLYTTAREGFKLRALARKLSAGITTSKVFERWLRTEKIKRSVLQIQMLRSRAGFNLSATALIAPAANTATRSGST